MSILLSGMFLSVCTCWLPNMITLPSFMTCFYWFWYTLIRSKSVPCLILPRFIIIILIFHYYYYYYYYYYHHHHHHYYQSTQPQNFTLTTLFRTRLTNELSIYLLLLFTSRKVCFQSNGRTYVEGVRTRGAERICWPKRDRETGKERERERGTLAQRKLRNEVFRNLYSSPNTSRLIESKMM